MICAFAAVIGVFALVNAKEKPIEYSREELAELFEKYLNEYNGLPVYE